MAVIGITGGISTGKSTFCECLREALPTAKFFNADEAAHVLLELSEVKREIRAEFGSDVFSSDGDLNRAKLRPRNARLSGFCIHGFAANGRQRRNDIAILPGFSLLIFHFSMKPAVKICATEWSWWPVRRRCS
jgi:Dephospho-CoA kinase